MNLGPPFERYPGPSLRDDASYRVISPWRDALAWVSIAGPLTVTRYLIRDGSIWEDVLPVSLMPNRSKLVWSLDWRDPVELAFRIGIDGADVTAMVRVTRAACEIRVHGNADPARVLTCMSLPMDMVIEQYDGGLLLDLPAQR